MKDKEADPQPAEVIKIASFHTLSGKIKVITRPSRLRSRPVQRQIKETRPGQRLMEYHHNRPLKL
jgi:hypothetical protein